MRLTKTAKTAITSVAIILVLAAVAFAAYLGLQPSTNVPKQSFTLYFLDSTGTDFSKETHSLEVPAEVAASDEKLLSLLTEALISGPKDAVVSKRAIPADARLISLKINDNRIATVDFSKEFSASTDLENNLAVCTVVLTLCETGKVDKVAVHVNGMEIIGQGKMPLGALGKDDIVNAADPEKATAQKTVKLYYPNSTANELVLEERALPVDGGKIDEITVLTELIKGTSVPEAVNVIPASTKVLSCETKDGICYVNLSKDFIDKKPQGSSSETLLIESVIYTLTELDGVDKVMFLIEGEKTEAYGQMVFNEPFERTVGIPINVVLQ